MDIENLPTLQAVDFGTLEDPARPVVSLNWRGQGPHRVPGHRHPRAQIIYQVSGVYRVTTERGSFVVPPQQAIWIPSLIYHETFTNDSAHAFMLFVDQSLAGAFPKDCMVVEVSPFLAQVFVRAVQYGNNYEASGREARLVQVMLDELASLGAAPLQLPMAADKRLRRLMDQLLEQPSEERGIEELALDCGASSRTLARLFRTETGMTFGEWRNKLRLLAAIERLGQGQSVTSVALDMGYHSPSAFIAMFRRTLGVPPSRYMKQQSVDALQ